MLPAARAERLPALGCVNLGNAHLDIDCAAFLFTARRQRVAISNADHKAGEHGSEQHARPIARRRS
jgi:hypothetical protein